MTEGPIQLRDYRIAPGALAAFVAAWTAGVLSLRRRFGFTIRGAWTIPEEDRFIWLLGYEGPGTFEEADRAYYASADRAAIHPDPAQWIAESRTGFVVPVDVGMVAAIVDKTLGGDGGSA